MEFGPAHWIILAVAAQRLSELVIARRNTASLLAKGAVEHFPGHYPFFIALHGSWLVVLTVAVGPDTVVNWGVIGIFAGLQLGRLWVLGTLGERWTTRILIVPDSPPIRHGPFRWVRHPNYLVVALEIPCLPLAFGLWPVAALWGALNLLLLNHRIRREDSAWASR